MRWSIEYGYHAETLQVVAQQEEDSEEDDDDEEESSDSGGHARNSTDAGAPAAGRTLQYTSCFIAFSHHVSCTALLGTREVVLRTQTWTETELTSFQLYRKGTSCLVMLCPLCDCGGCEASVSCLSGEFPLHVS